MGSLLQLEVTSPPFFFAQRCASLLDVSAGQVLAWCQMSLLRSNTPQMGIVCTLADCLCIVGVFSKVVDTIETGRLAICIQVIGIIQIAREVAVFQ